MKNVKPFNDASLTPRILLEEAFERVKNGEVKGLITLELNADGVRAKMGISPMALRDVLYLKAFLDSEINVGIHNNFQKQTED